MLACAKTTTRQKKSTYTIGQIVRQFGQSYIDKYQPDYRIRSILERIGNCRTQALGGHKIVCDSCGHHSYTWNSCGDRHCPQCQNIKKELWIGKMSKHLLPVKHFHVIFTIPHELNDLVFYNQRLLYSLFFQSAWAAIQQVIGKGNRTGMVATVHTWGSNLSFHPHLHCIIPSGFYDGIDWQKSNHGRGFFFCKSIKLREAFKDIFLKKFRELVDIHPLILEGESIDENPHLLKKVEDILQNIAKKKWTVRIEAPVLGVEQIIEYLGRYVRRVAITNSRIVDVNSTTVTFNYKQYAKQKEGEPAPIGTIKMEGEKFLQRFTQHFLPVRFHSVRYCGIYNFAAKKTKNAIYTKITGTSPPIYQKPKTRAIVEKMLGHDPDMCTNCGVIGDLYDIPIAADSSLIFKLTKKRRRAGPAANRVRPPPVAKQGVLNLEKLL